MKILVNILTALCGIAFIISAYFKLYPIEVFEYTLVNTGWFNWEVSMFFSRIIISVEFFLGIMIILNHDTKKIFIQFSILLLSLFTIYLAGLMITSGDNGNCGCFGTFIPMTPSQGIIKNMMMIGILSYSLKYKDTLPIKINRYIVALCFLMVGVLPFILNPINFSRIDNYNQRSLNYKFDFNLLYNSSTNPPPKVALQKGKKIIAFFSLNCPHCRVAALKFHVLKKQNNQLPLYMVLNGDSSDLPSFFQITMAEDVPHHLFLGPDYIKMSGPDLPSILWLEDGKVVKKSNYLFLQQNEIENWLTPEGLSMNHH